jgi:hypothetical protein
MRSRERPRVSFKGHIESANRYYYLPVRALSDGTISESERRNPSSLYDRFKKILIDGCVVSYGSPWSSGESQAERRIRVGLWRLTPYSR